MAGKKRGSSDVLDLFAPPVRRWFESSFSGPTAAQRLGWPAIAAGDSTLILAPTGSGKTLTAFLWCINRLMFGDRPADGTRVVYVSPLKALAVDVERNLRAPIVGIMNAAPPDVVAPRVAVRTGDTPARERQRFQREPAEILITTPESLYLMLTSSVREAFRTVDTIIIDEIHSLVPTKRGAHLALSLERLEELCDKPPQRIGLSATQRPLDEVARFLGGAYASDGDTTCALPPASESEDDLARSIEDEFTSAAGEVRYRPVTIVDTAERKRLSLRVEVPVEDMSEIGVPVDIPSGSAAGPAIRSSIWPAIHPRLLELVQSHQSTLMFVNNRRLSERLANALNELAGEILVRAHHGSLAREQRIEIEDALKSGRLRGLIATSSLELGIDMGAIDLVVQIEAPPSVASGMQRIGRASHQVNAVSEGIIFPKYRGDLVAAAAVTRAMKRGEIEATRYPRNPLDVLAQQIVAAASADTWKEEDLFRLVRRAAPFAELTRPLFDGVLDMLSGVYPSDEFADLRPRVTWDRIERTITARPGAKKIAVLNGGTIPDRGLYGVFLASGAERTSARVGELDEEMVFESRVGETFVLGASTWRIDEITHDRVLVVPAPGEPGKMPFWHGDMADRAAEFGAHIGALVRTIGSLPRERALEELRNESDLDPLAAENFVRYLEEQRAATEAVPDDRTIVIERSLDELGDWRVCVLSPFGGRVHAPWAMAATARIREELGIDVETMWTDDGFVVRFPETDEPPDAQLVIPEESEIIRLVVRQLGSTSLFAARFRENSARALLLPRQRPGKRAPLWQQRKRAYDLLQVASRFGSFPMLLETYRECLRDIFDLPALVDLSRRIANRSIRTVTVDSQTPSPFASSILFRYVANYIYDGDAPLAERRAQALTIDQSQLRELLGEIDMRELLDLEAMDETERRLQFLDPEMHVRSADALHDLLLRLGDLSVGEIEQRSTGIDVTKTLKDLVAARRAIEAGIGGEKRFIAAEDAGRFRDAIGVPLPTGLPERFLRPVEGAFTQLVLRYARNHGPFTSNDFARRYAVAAGIVESELHRQTEAGKLVEGEFRPGGTQREWCDAEVLRTIRRRSLAKLRREVEPAEPWQYGEFLVEWHEVGRKRRGLAALLDTIETLQGAPLVASSLESEILPSRISGYRSSDLDQLASSGEVVWIGVDPIGEHDGRVALFLADHLRYLRPEPQPREFSELEGRIIAFLETHGASFFGTMSDEVGGFPQDTLDALWNLVWAGLVTNDTFHALRSVTRSRETRRRTSRVVTRRSVPPGAEGRWTLVDQLVRGNVKPTERALALAQQFLTRYGVVTREAVASENITGGFSSVYDVLKLLEESGKVRRGYFIATLAATQFAVPGAVDRLRSLRRGETPHVVMLAATDPANPYGSILRWPGDGSRQLTRSAGATVIIVDGALGAYVSRGMRQLTTCLPDEEPDRTRVADAIAAALKSVVESGKRRAILIEAIDGEDPSRSGVAPSLEKHGFSRSAMGYQLRGAIFGSQLEEPEPEEEEIDA